MLLQKVAVETFLYKIHSYFFFLENTEVIDYLLGKETQEKAISVKV